MPILCKTNNFLTIVDLSMKKIKYFQAIRNLDDTESRVDGAKSVKECYEVVLDMFTALDQCISDQRFKN